MQVNKRHSLTNNKISSDNKLLSLLYILCMLVVFSLFASGCSSPKQLTTLPKDGYVVVDSSGATLNFTEKPQRIVSLSISTDEILLDLVASDRIAALSYLSDDPGISNIAEQVKNIKGRVNASSPEALLALHPDLVLVPDFVKPEIIQSLRDMQLKVYVYKTPYDLLTIEECIKYLAEAVGEQEKGARLIADMKAELTNITGKRADISTEKQKRVVFIRSNGAYYRPKSSFDNICYWAKVKNALTELNYSTAVVVSQEEIVRLNPDAFVIADWNYDGKHDAQAMKNEILMNPAYMTTNAVKNKEIYLLPARHLLSLSQYIVYAVEDLSNKAYENK